MPAPTEISDGSEIPAVSPDSDSSDSTDLTDPSDLTELAVELLVTSARFTRLASRESQSSIPHALWRALSHIEELGPLRISELAAADRCSQPTATTMVQRLEQRGWVRRAADPDDSRAVRVAVTAAGRAGAGDQPAYGGRAPGRAGGPTQ